MADVADVAQVVVRLAAAATQGLQEAQAELLHIQIQLAAAALEAAMLAISVAIQIQVTLDVMEAVATQQQFTVLHTAVAAAAAPV